MINELGNVGVVGLVTAVQGAVAGRLKSVGALRPAAALLLILIAIATAARRLRKRRLRKRVSRPR